MPGDLKISQLTLTGAALATDEYAINQGGVSKRVNLGQIATYLDTLFLTPAEANAAYSLTGHTHTFASLTSKPTTLAGYGITDAEPYLGVPSVSGYVLSSTTGGVRSWIAPATGGSGTPGGSNTQVQFNNSGAFGGDAGLTYTPATTTQAVLALQGTGATIWQIVAAGSAGNAGYFPINDFGIYNSSTTGTPLRITGNDAVLFGSTSPVGWMVSRGGSIDTALYRNAAGIVEINNGTAGQYRDLYVRDITLQSSGIITGNGTVPTGGTTGQVLGKVSGTNYDVAWQAPTTGGSGSPGGSTTQVQFNDAGAFAGDADLTWDKTNNNLALTGQFQAPMSTAVTGGYSFAGDTDTGIWDHTVTGSLVFTLNGSHYFMLTGANARFASTSTVGWSSSDALSAAIDTGFYRNASGVVEINNGTAGQYRDLMCRYITTQTNGILIGGGMSITGDGAGRLTFGYGGTSPFAVSNSSQQGIGLPSNGFVGFSNTTTPATGWDVALYRSSAGVIEINNGTAGTYRDLICRKITARSIPRVTTASSGATLSPNSDTDEIFSVSLTNAVTTVSAPSGTPVDGQPLTFRVIGDATPRAISGWNAIYRFSTAFPAPSTTAASTTHTWGFRYNATIPKWDCLAQTVNP